MNGYTIHILILVLLSTIVYIHFALKNQVHFLESFENRNSRIGISHVFGSCKPEEANDSFDNVQYIHKESNIIICPETVENYINSTGLLKPENFDNPHLSSKPIKLTKLPKFDKKQDTMVFLHIGKAGGTSFDKTMNSISRKLSLKYIGNRHFDWDYIEQLKKSPKQTTTIKPVTILRNPVDRAISNYFFHADCSTCQHEQWKEWREELENHVEIEEYFTNPKIMMKTHEFWNDGQAAVWWLAGMHLGGWVRDFYAKLSEEQKNEIERELVLNPGKVMLRAAENLRKEIVWFGILEDQERSFEMLAYQLGLDKINLEWANKNTNNPEQKHKTESKKKHQVSDKTRRFIEKLIPQDMWLYKYARLLFEARYNLFKTGVWIEPEIPELPSLNCQNSRFILRCINPAIYYQATTGNNEMDQKQMEMLPQLNNDQHFLTNILSEIT